MTYRIRFDFPEQPQPVWTIFLANAPGYTRKSEHAATFETEKAASLILASYGASNASYGSIEKVPA